MSLLAPRKLTRLLAVLPILAPLPAGQAQEPGDEVPVVPAPFAEELPGGAHLVLLEAADPGREGHVRGLLLFEVGAVHEPAGRTGLLQVLAVALRSGGSVLYDGEALDAWLERYDSSLDISSGPNGLEVAFSAPRERIDGLLDRIGSLLTTPSYPEAEVAAARARVLERLAQDSVDARLRADRALREVALGSACAWARCASPAEVRSVTRGEVLGFHRAHVGPANLWIGLALEGDPAPVRRRVQRLAASLPRASSPIAPATPAFDQRLPGPISVVDLPGTTQVELRAAVPAPSEPQNAAALGLWFEALGQAGAEDPALAAARKRIDGLRFEPLMPQRGLAPLGWVASGRAPVEEASTALRALVELLAGDLKRPVSAALLSQARRAATPTGDVRSRLLEAVHDAAAGISPATRAEARRAQLELDDESIRQAVRTRLPTRPPVLVAVGPARRLYEPLEGLAPVVLLTGQAEPRGTPEGLALRARLLEAVGGVETWARMGGLSLVGEVSYIGSERPVSVRLWRDLLGRRLRLEHTQGGVRTTIVVTPQTAWSRAIQSVYDLPQEQWERTLFRERRQLARVLHDLASDPRLDSRRGIGGRLEVHSAEGMLCWIEMDSLDRPARLGYDEPPSKQALYTFGDWVEQQGCLWPARVTQPGEGTEFRWSRFTSSDELDGELFERPAR